MNHPVSPSSRRRHGRGLALALSVCSIAAAQDADWPGYLGPRTDAVSRGASPPTTWSDGENVAWKTRLPGAGSSSPVIFEDRVYLTCYSGFGVDREEPGDVADLRHHIVCLERDTGKIVWDRSFEGGWTTDPRQLQIDNHGFSTPTPVTDGETIYAYFGKVGVIAVDRDGETLWEQSLGELDPDEPRPAGWEGRPTYRWGAAASPVIHGELLIVNASEESNSIRALNRKTGELVWKHETNTLEGSVTTPVIFDTPDGEQVLVAVPGGEVRGIDPSDGELLWQVETGTRGGQVPIPLQDGGRIFAMGGGAPCFVIRLSPKDGEDRVEAKWPSLGADIPSPILHDGHVFLVGASGMGVCVDISTGEPVFDDRLEGRTGTIYAAPVIADDKIYVVTREKGVYVYTADGNFELLARNRFESDSTKFNAAPAIVGGRIYLRSQTTLYCIAEG